MPLMKPACSDRRKATVSATPAGVPTRLTGCRAAMCPSVSGWAARYSSNRAVLMEPGRDRVSADPVRSVVDRYRPGQALDGGLGGGAGQRARSAVAEGGVAEDSRVVDPPGQWPGPPGDPCGTAGSRASPLSADGTSRSPLHRQLA
jgi:hypothetical protein